MMSTPQRRSNALGAARRAWRTALTGLLLVAAVMLAPLSRAEAEMNDYRVADPGAIYLGNCRQFTKPCVVKADRVYRSISEYREILDKGLTDKDVQYHFLMKKASERFLEAVKRMAKDVSVDIVGEVGAIKSAKTGIAEPTDRTDDAIAKLN